MNLVPHGILLQVTVWLINFQHGFRLCSGGEPGYLDFDNLPETNFSCVGKVIGGYYADVETGCQMFHVCTIGQKDEIMDIKFLCLNGTVFDQETRVCERVDEVDCSKSERFYNLNLELYGNNAVTLSLHEVPDDEGEPTESIDDQHSSTARPTTSTTTTTTQRPTKPPAPPTTTVYHQQNNGYSQRYQNQPLYSTPQSSQSKSLYDDKNSGYHHQYIFHNGEEANNQATSFQLFSNQGVSSTTNQPQVHQARYGTTSSPQIILNGPSTVSPLFHGVSSTIQTLLNNNVNNPSFINPLYHNHGIPSTTEHFTVHSNNPRETQEYHEDGEPSEDRGRRPLQAVQSTNQGKISKLSISPVPTESHDDEDSNESVEEPTPTSQGSKISTNFLPTPTTPEPTARSYYPTPRTSPKPDSGPTQIIRHIHLSPSQPIPQLKPQQITINLPPPDIQRIVQNPSPLLPSQSRVIVTAKASVSDESGRPLNSSELVILPLPTIPASYDDYKEGDESFDPFYRDVPKIRQSRSAPLMKKVLEDTDEVYTLNRRRRAPRRLKRAVFEDQTDYEDDEELAPPYDYFAADDSVEDEDTRALLTDSEEAMDIATIKANFKKFKALLLGRRTSGEILSERKTSKEHFGGVNSKSTYDGVELTDDTADEDGSSPRREEEEAVRDTEGLTDDRESNGDANPGDLNNDDNVDSEFMPMAKTSEIDEKDDVKPEIDAKKTEAMDQSEPKSPSDVKTTDDQPDPSTVESYTRQLYESKLVSDNKKSVGTSAMNLEDSEDETKAKTIKSSRRGKGLGAEEEAKPSKTSNVGALTGEETAKSKSAETTIESDAEEYIEPVSILNTKDSDLEEYVEPKSAPTTKEADIEESVEPKTNAKESDSKEYVRPKSSVNTEAPDAHEAVVDSEKPAPVLNIEKSIVREVLKDSDAEEHVVDEAAPIPSDEGVAEISLETMPTGDAEGRTSEDNITTEITAGIVEIEPESKINHNRQEAHEESRGMSKNEEDSLTVEGIKSEITSDVGELNEEKIVKPKAEMTDALSKVKEAEKPEPPMKTQVFKDEQTDHSEDVGPKPEENLGSKEHVSFEDSDVDELAEAQTERSEVISKVPQEAEESVTPDTMKLQQAALDQKPEVKEKLTDHGKGKKPDSLVEKVESVVEMNDSPLVEKSETTIIPDDKKESKLSRINLQKLKPIISSGWKPAREKTFTSHSAKTENGAPTDDNAGVYPPPQSSKEVDAKAKIEAENRSKSSKSLSKNGVGDAEDKPKLVDEQQGIKSSNKSTVDEKPSNDAQLLKSKEIKPVKHPEKGKESLSSKDDTDNSSPRKVPDDDSTAKSLESPNKIPSDVLDYNDTSEKDRKSSGEDSRGEYDDYASEEYISGSREPDTYERRSDEIDSQEPTLEYTDSRSNSADEYSTSAEDYVPVSGEVYSTEDSRPISEELYSTEDSRPRISNEDYSTYSTEGVLKFTDEIPEPKKKHSKQKNRAATKAKVSSEDYVDDNYEPEHYRENSAEKNSEEKEDQAGYESSGEEKLNDEGVDDHLTTTTTTTTARPVPPSLFRPFSVRKNYKYIPPTTTPNPVVIKHRFGLLNPRPAKPIKSYNELAPRPVIRKTPLSLRKPFGTSESTTENLPTIERRIDDFENASEVVWNATEYVDEDEKLRENKMTRSANDVSLNETLNESSGHVEDKDVPVIGKENLPKNLEMRNENDTSPDPSSNAETTPSITPAYLSTPYPLLKATTSGNLAVEEAKESKKDDTKVVRANEPTTEIAHAKQVEGSSEFSTSSTSTTEGTAASSTTDEKPLKADRDHEEEAPKVSKVSFSCIDKESYRFYGDPRDCRLFHYCSPGFTAKQMLDFRFVCEDSTTFDEESQSCRYDLENSKCANRQW